MEQENKKKLEQIIFGLLVSIVICFTLVCILSLIGYLLTPVTEIPEDPCEKGEICQPVSIESLGLMGLIIITIMLIALLAINIGNKDK